jgi:hypothetical protein
MDEPIEEAYFNWLCAKVLSPYINNYHDLMRILHRTEFVWFVPGDRNRKEDGVELREHFLNETRFEGSSDWRNELCSVLEVLIAFANRASFQIDIPPSDCFWLFMENLNLKEYRQIAPTELSIIEEILYDFIWRTYDSHGCGGLFPLDEPEEDQRDVEIWYQFCAWVDEKALI